MNDLPDNPDAQGEPPPPSLARTVARFVMGMALMLIGVGAIVGGLILHFAVKAERLDLFPYAGRLVILIGVAVIFVAIALAGWRVAVSFGMVTLVVGIGMLIFGFLKLAEPSLRFYAPLGFFVSLGGGLLIWGGLQYAKEAQEAPGNKTDLLE